MDSFMIHFTPRYVCHLLECIWFFFPCHPHQIENGLLTLWRIFFAGGGESWGRVGWGLENLSKHQVSVPFLSRMLQLNMTQSGFQYISTSWWSGPVVHFRSQAFHTPSAGPRFRENFVTSQFRWMLETVIFVYVVLYPWCVGVSQKWRGGAIFFLEGIQIVATLILQKQLEETVGSMTTIVSESVCKTTKPNSIQSQSIKNLANTKRPKLPSCLKEKR